MPIVDFDVCVRGSGVTAHVLALNLAQGGLKVALQREMSQKAHESSQKDIRAYALNHVSKEYLSQLRVWPSQAAAKVVQMRVSMDAQANLVFGSSQEAMDWRDGMPLQNGQNLTYLPWMVEAQPLLDLLKQAVEFQPYIEVVEPTLDGSTAGPKAALTAICEGANSAFHARIAQQNDHWMTRLPYEQNAIAARVVLDTPHHGIAYQWFYEGQIIALLPLVSPNEAALVWSMPPESAAHHMAMDEETFEHTLMATIEQASEVGTEFANHDPTQGDNPIDSSAALSSVWAMKLSSVRQMWPLQLAYAKQWVGQHAQWGTWVLVGDCAHSVHPLAGQGLNMGLADCKSLVRVLLDRQRSKSIDYWRGLGDLRLLRRYERERKLNTMLHQVASDGLQRLVTHPHILAQVVRTHGFDLVNQTPSFKRWLMQRASGD